MSLAKKDVEVIRDSLEVGFRLVIREELNSAISARIEPRFVDIEGKMEALENDIKDIYLMISQL
jgi:hypothetical protein